jgi:hypothetical protein
MIAKGSRAAYSETPNSLKLKATMLFDTILLNSGLFCGEKYGRPNDISLRA